VRSLTCPRYVKKTFSVEADCCLHDGVHRPAYPSAQKVAAHQHKHPNGIIGVRSGLQKSSPGRRGSDCRPGLGAAGAPEPGQKIERRPCVPVDSSDRVNAYPFGDGCEVQNGWSCTPKGSSPTALACRGKMSIGAWFPCARVLVRAVIRALTPRLGMQLSTRVRPQKPSDSAGLSDRPAIDRAGAPDSAGGASDEALIRLHWNFKPRPSWHHRPAGNSSRPSSRCSKSPNNPEPNEASGLHRHARL
jgi:hypothetical protein